MSWLRSAISKAAEVGGKNIGPNLSRTVRTVAQHAGQAVAGGAKIVQDRLVGRNLNSAKNAIRRLDEVARNARGDERVQALARWLGALKVLGREQKPSSILEESQLPDGADVPHDEITSPRQAAKVLFYDFEGDGQPMNFREIFLRSHALENIVTSMILEAPEDEEVNLLLEIFGLCLAGGKELHIAIISSIQDLAKAFSGYNEEFMSKREYLLQYARDAVSGLKLNADLERLDAEISPLMQLISKQQETGLTKEDGSKKTRELLQLEIHSRDLLQRKRLLMHAGDTQESRTEKVELLKTLSTSLKQSASEAEKRVSENRSQKEEALKYRTTKAQEVAEMEKVVAAEVKVLQLKQQDLELQLKEINNSLAAAMNRHLNIQEEKEKFDEASSGVVAHLAAEEEELTRSITGQNVEANVLGTWLSFLEDTWKLQASCIQQKDKYCLDALKGLKEQFLHMLSLNLSQTLGELDSLLKELKLCSSSILEDGNKSAEPGPIESEIEIYKTEKTFEDRFVEAEGKVISILRNVEVMKEELQVFASIVPGSIGDGEKDVMSAFDSIEHLRKEIEGMERPTYKSLGDGALNDQPKASITKSGPSLQGADPVILSQHHDSVQPEDFFEEEARRQALERDAGTEVKKTEKVDGAEETEGWEFDEFEEDLKEGALS